MRLVLLLSTALVASSLAAANGNDALGWIAQAGGATASDAAGHIVAVDLRASWASDSDIPTLASIPTLTRLDLSETRITDHGLRALKTAPRISDLNLRYAELVTDEGVAALKNWKHLVSLNLEGTKITDSALQHLSALTSLEALNIGSVQVTDAGLDALTSLSNLKELTLGGDKLTDTGLQALRQLPELTALNLGGLQRADSGPWSVSFTQTGLESIATLKALRTLRLQGTLITAHGLDTLKNLTQIELLDLHDCAQINDDAIPVLTGMRSIRFLDLTATKVSEAGLAQLRKSRPESRILHGASTLQPATSPEE